MAGLTPVQEFYKDRTVFVTGASGFMGKVLIEKLLYSCADIKEVIILMRPKKGKVPETRLEEMYRLPMFQRIRDEKPHVWKKLTLVQGDVTFDSLGLSGETLKHITENTSIVFHMAATLKLEGNLKDAIQMNTLGTKRTLDIAKQMKKLVAFIHLSTAFCNCDQEIMYEKVYEFDHKPEDLMRMAEWMDAKTLELITPALLKPHPNTYTYSKRLAEILVRDQYPNMPVVITRPSIVSPAAYEPLPGWVDNLNGPTGLMAGAGKGVIRSMLIDDRHKSEVIPVDYAINGLITIAYETSTAKEKPSEIPVYNITCADHKKVPWGKVIELSKKVGYQYPVQIGLWYPDGCITTNRLRHTINVILFHYLPAYFIDFILLLAGQKRFMVRLQKRISIGLGVLQFFSMRAWNFKSDRFSNVWQKLTDKDKEIFNMNMHVEESDEEYMKVCLLGGREYLLKEPLDTLPKARRQLWIPKEVPVFNITVAEHKKVPWKVAIEFTKKVGYQYPAEIGLWYPDGCVTTNRLHHNINVLLFHWLPAIFIDFLMLLLGQKRFMIRIQKRISIGLEVLQFFTMRAWYFKSENYAAVWKNLTDKDKEIFNQNMDTEHTNEEYMLRCLIGGRQYILKEPLETLPKARRQLMMPQNIPVYNITMAEHRKVQWKTAIDLSRKLGYEYPTEIGLWYPDGTTTTNWLHHKINVILFHWLPAYLIDFLMLILGQKRFMVRIQTRVSIGLECLQFFTMRPWKFVSEKYESVWKNLTEEDKKIFNQDMNTDLSTEQYMLNSLLGGRQYILKEDPSTIPKARKQLWVAYFVDRICKILILGYLFYLLLKQTGLLETINKMIA